MTCSKQFFNCELNKDWTLFFVDSVAGSWTASKTSFHLHISTFLFCENVVFISGLCKPNIKRSGRVPGDLTNNAYWWELMGNSAITVLERFLWIYTNTFHVIMKKPWSIIELCIFFLPLWTIALTSLTSQYYALMYKKRSLKFWLKNAALMGFERVSWYGKDSPAKYFTSKAIISCPYRCLVCWSQLSARWTIDST